MPKLIQDNLEILLNAWQGLPSRDEVDSIMLLAHRAQERGYFNPDEDEQLRAVYLRYLSIRQNIWELLEEIQGELKKIGDKQGTHYLAWFTLGFASAFILMRAAHYLVEISESYPTIRQKLDEAEPLYGIEWGSFSEIYRKMRSSRTMLPFRRAVSFYCQHKQAIHELSNNSKEWADLLDLFEQDEGLLSQTKTEYIKRRLVYRKFQNQTRQNIIYRKAMYKAFKSTGCIISDLKNPRVPVNKIKRVTAKVREQVAELLQPGDYIITRHDDAMSNLFLPGFWPHAALYIGTEEQRSEIGIDLELGQENLSNNQGEVQILEAKKDGVKLRHLDETLAVDAFVIFRPQLDLASLKKALQKALQHRDKKYDFLFDFNIPQRLVCTEVVYRGFHGVANIEFHLSRRSGRYCLSAEDLINQSMMANYFKPVAICGVEGNELVSESTQVRKILKNSYEATWNN